jgi:hypothetical protein
MIEWALQSTYEMTYEEAVLYCTFCNFNGYRDWRMPTYQECLSLKYMPGWFIGSTSESRWIVTPVRDITLDFAPVTDEMMTYDEAVLYCQFLEYNGHTDWRLPTQNEWLLNEPLRSSWFLNRGYQLLSTVAPVRDNDSASTKNTKNHDLCGSSDVLSILQS